MFEQYEDILKNYNIQVHNLHKGRGAIIVDANTGLKILKEVKLHDSKIKFLYDLQKRLGNKGFLIDALIKSKDNELYVVEDNKKYVLKEWVNGREVLFNEENEILICTKKMAEIHKVTLGPITNPEYIKYDKTNTLLDTLNRHNKELVRIRNNIRKMGRWSEFDILYLKSFSYYYYEAIRALKYLQKDYYEGMKIYKNNKVIIHGQYNHHNLILDYDNRLHIVNFDYATYNLPIIDLYSMLRKILEKNNWDIKLGFTIIEEYNNIYKLCKQELNIMYDLFIYPEKFWKISNYYFNLNKAWKPKQTLIKLKKLVKQEENKKEFIKALYQLIKA